MCPIIHFFSFDINVYEVCTFLGFGFLAVYLWKSLQNISGIKKSHLCWALFFGFFIQYYGGALLPYLYQWIYFAQAPSFKSFGTVGRYFHSVFLVSLVYVLFICRVLRWPTRQVLDHLAIGAILMSAIGRVGCFFQGCCGGKPSNLPWAMQFPGNTVATHPTQVYMIIAEFTIWLLLLKVNKNKKFNGETFWKGVLCYSIYRFLVEFVRINPVFVGGLTHAQVFSLLTVVIAWLVIIYYESKNLSEA